MTADKALSVDDIFKVNKLRFGWHDDSSTFGQTEYWATYEELMARADKGRVRGDCDDFAELCVHDLRANGHRARYVLCITEGGEGHLVGECEGYILDNRQEWVIPQDRLNYTWVALSGYLPGEPWHIVVK